MQATQHSEHAGQKFYVNIEGVEYPWNQDTITMAEIRSLGNIPSDQVVLHEAPDGSERTLGDNETVTLQPGHRHGRASRYRRG